MSSEAQAKRVALLLAVVTFQSSEGAGAGEWEPRWQPCRRLGAVENCRFEDQSKSLEMALETAFLWGVTDDEERLEISRREGESEQESREE